MVALSNKVLVFIVNIAFIHIIVTMDTWTVLSKEEKEQLKKDIIAYKKYIEDECTVYIPPEKMAKQQKELVTQGLPLAYCLGALSCVTSGCNIQ